MERVRQRDESAARTLVDRLKDHVEKLVRAHLPRADEIEDLMQDIFLKLFSRLGQYRGQMPFEHWVSRVAVTTCIDKLRAQKRRPVYRWSDLTEEQQAAFEAVTETAEPVSQCDGLNWQVLEKLMASLNPAERLMITLFDLEEKSVKEVAAITGWNSGVVRIRAFRARQKLKALYQQLEAAKPIDATL